MVRRKAPVKKDVTAGQMCSWVGEDKYYFYIDNTYHGCPRNSIKFSGDMFGQPEGCHGLF